MAIPESISTELIIKVLAIIGLAQVCIITGKKALGIASTLAICFVIIQIVQPQWVEPITNACKALIDMLRAWIGF